ncbi:hypothetical protein MtrunA17_Chr4g0026031 [Medicago truncatula]|uniref:Uncharacterized protein n=1 Tax=Medicago truncatula TaxID=3880 RepID=A0A396I6M3_MEDTR|nr:hypothetical protein MtrunA17_Chr4g0026031 [Medicago truncatula]
MHVVFPNSKINRGILHISAKLQGGICKTSCSLTEKFDGRGKLTNVVKFQGVIEVLLISENLITFLILTF